MASLGETIDAMRRLREGATQADAILQETRGFGDDPGGLRMLSYLPESARPGAALVVVLHGCTQTADAFARQSGWVALAERFGFALLAPEQRPANNLQRCFNWFEPARAQREAASILAMIAHLVAAARLDPQRVFVTGLSAGGALTSHLLALHPERFAGGAIIAGLPYGIADGAQAAWAAMGGRRAGSAASILSASRAPRISVWHGDADPVVNRANADDIVRQWLVAHGAPDAAAEVETIGRLQRTRWRSPRSREAIVEANIVSGLGHGAPLATQGDDPLGAVAPHMLEAGVSSALETARFWKLLDGPAAARAQEMASAQTTEPPRANGVGVLDTLKRHVPPKVGAIIAKALKGAGLMK
jgi:poly(hydroxyalkanoate) depolymerase family esterase